MRSHKGYGGPLTPRKGTKRSVLRWMGLKDTSGQEGRPKVAALSSGFETLQDWVREST